MNEENEENKNFELDFYDGILMLVASVISYNMYKLDGYLAIFYGWFFITAILFAIKLSFKDGFTLRRFKKRKL